MLHVWKRYTELGRRHCGEATGPALSQHSPAATVGVGSDSLCGGMGQVSGSAGSPSPTDRRLGPIDQVVGSSRTRILSVDVFDTLLLRKVPKPSDIHLVVGQRLCASNELPGHLTPRLYSRLRILAEAEARNARSAADGSVEVDLLEIHRILAGATGGTPVEALIERELEVEREFVFPDRRLADFVRETASRRGLPVVAVSDTYLSSAQVTALLAGAIPDLTFSRVFTSSDFRTGKGGQLWKMVLQQLEVEPDTIVHFGDSEEADVHCASLVGIRAVHCPASTARFIGVEARERIAGPPGDPSHWCDEHLGDGGISAIRRRATHLSPPRPLTAEEEVTWESGTSVLGPIFTGFARWVRDRAHAIGAERVLCLMREGQFLKTLVDRSGGLDARDLRVATGWASREALARASIYGGTESELRAFMARIHPPSPLELAVSFGLAPDDLPQTELLVRQFHLTRGGPDAGNSYIDRVLDTPDLVAKIVRRSADRRQLLWEHIRSAVGSGSGPVAVVDIGWAGTIQEGLQAIADREGADLRFHGLFLLAHIGSSERLLRGTVLEGYLGDSGDIPFDLSPITGGPELIELVSMCDRGSFLEMGPDGEPVLAPDGIGPAQTASRALVQEGVAAYQSEWLDHHRSWTGGDTFEVGESGASLLGEILKRFLGQPIRDEAEAFSWWEHERNFGSGGSDALVPTGLRPQLEYRTPESLHRSRPSELYWVSAAAALIDDDSADAVRLIRESLTLPGRFSAPSEAGPARLVVEGPTGVELVASDLPVDVNRRGLTMIEWDGPLPPDGRQLVVHPASRPALLRIDAVHVELCGADGAVVGQHRWVPGDGLAALPLELGYPVTDGAVLVDGASRLAFDLTGAEGTIRVRLAGAYLPAGGMLAGAGSVAAIERRLKASDAELEAIRSTKLFRATAAPRRVYGLLRRAAWRRR